MPGIYGPPQPRKPVARAPEPPARPDSPSVALLRWVGALVLFVAAMALWVWVEMQKPSEQQQQLLEIQQRIDRLSSQPMPRFDLKLPPIEPLPPFEPLQTAEIIPSSKLVPTEAPPPRQTAERIPPR
jgi:hypothetical protein